MMTLAALLEQGQRQLLDTGDPELVRLAGLEAQILLCHTLDIERKQLYAKPESKIPDKLSKTYLEQVEQRCSGQPLCYLTGQREFWSLELQVNRHTLIPRPETEHLVEAALKILRQTRHPEESYDIADLGTGSGAIALAIASSLKDKALTERTPEYRLTATDISDEALAIAKRNLQELHLENITLRQGSWYEAILDQRFHMIVSNPPYIAKDDHNLDQGDVRFEPRLALISGSDGLDALRAIITGASQHLHQKGWLILEHGYDQATSVEKMLQNNAFNSIRTIQDYAGHDRISLGQWYD